MKNRVKELRTARRWSQGELAAQLAVSRQTINAIETEKYDPSLPLALKLARLFKQPVEAIFEEREKDTAEVQREQNLAPLSGVNPGPQELVL
jgi:putative transcriptional regulator